MQNEPINQNKDALSAALASMPFISRNAGLVSSLSIVALLSGWPMSAAHAEWAWSVGTGASYTDNQFRDSTDKRDETSLDAVLIVDGEHTGPRLDTTLSANLDYGFRTQESKGDVLGGLGATLVYRLLPKYLHFTVEETFGQIQRALDQPDTPDNRINFNVISAGPNIILPLGKRSSLDVSGRWMRSDYEDAPANSTRKTVEAALNYALNSFSVLSLNASNSNVDYDDLDSSFSYDIQEASLGYVRRTDRTTVDLTGGATRVKYPQRDLPTGTLLRALLAHDFSERMTVNFAAGTSYTDAGGSFVLDQSIIGVDRGALTGALSTDAFKSDYGDLSLRLRGVRMGITTGVRWDRARHDTQTTLDNTQKSVRMTISRRTSPRVEARVEGDYGKREFTRVPGEFTDYSIGLGLNWRFSTRISMDFMVQHFNGSRADDLVSATPYDYKENRASLRFLYSPNRRP